MMMGFGGIAVPWLFGVLTVAAIWVGVWWLLSAIGMTAQRSQPNTPPAPAATQLPPGTWQQPRFTAADAPPPLRQPDPEPHPKPNRAESDHR